MTREEFERRLKESGVNLTQADRDAMFAVLPGFETLKQIVRPANRPTSAEPALIFRASWTERP